MKKVLKRFIVMLLTLAMPLSGTALAESSETEDTAYVVEGKTYRNPFMTGRLLHNTFTN